MKMDVEHKAHIADLEARTPRTPLEVREACVEELKGYTEIVETHIVEAQQLLNEASHTWIKMEDIDGLVKVREALQKTQRELDAITRTMTDLLPILRMLKMGETTKLQAELQKLRTK